MSTALQVVPELVILVGLPAAGKTTFYHERFAATHVQVSKDLMRNRSGKQQRLLELIDSALAGGRSVVADNINATRADRAALIAAGRRRGAAVVGYVFTEVARDCLERNRRRTGREHVPAVAIHTAAKKFETVTVDEGFERLHAVRTTE